MSGRWTETDATLLARIRDLEWQQADRLRFAAEHEAKQGSARTEAAQAMQRDLQEVTRIIRVAEAFPNTRRRYNLTLAHHFEVLKLATDAERDDMLTKAVTNGWSARQTRREVLALRIATGDYQPQVDDDPVDTGLRSICQAYNRAPAASREMFLPLAQEAGSQEIDV